MPLGNFKRFYRDTNNDQIYRYIADSSLIQDRQIVANCLRVVDGMSCIIAGVAFKNFFVHASEQEVARALQQAPKHQQKAQHVLRPTN